MSYLDYCDYFARKCKYCKGERVLYENNVRKTCSCQLVATAKWRFEQVEITPSDLKYKSWSDFTGEIKDLRDGRLETVGRLNEDAFVDAWHKAMRYCFKDADPKSIKDRKNQLIIHQRVGRGENLIIVGGPRTGRTLLAALVFKEVVFACMMHNPKLEFRWVKVSNLLQSARWYGDKDLDDEMKEDMSKVDFLAIDGLDVVHQGVRKLGGTHTNPADLTYLDNLFAARLSEGLPTIITCSDEFWSLVTQRPQIIAKGWGEEFVAMLNQRGNVIIQLQKKVTKVD